ncbi:1,4-dihydroxy-2-naphthoate polyprenyltransferase [Brochothrix campestris]|uniref:1,4-dihydroxy-2-naphthoate octaprenyltransferase n=1 Tax=Brochothrix campestris FSL F6-1037 TaxID=1265861 RepID=W7CMW0_9LIST|nr:1,4-dihydroxy-2-naphthoate polyprenyltransferase [Brochothrix campestris]EUJ38005.1 1,4-dihydroxy-2-naphthoate octaprenyltransferase [Brochothrix campestris FSL F6-1037]
MKQGQTPKLARITQNKWWKLLRPHTLASSYVPVFVGSAAALHYTTFKVLPFLAMLFAAFLIQTGTNLFNEYYDYKRGHDDENKVGHGGAITNEKMSASFIRNLAFLSFIIALLLGLYLCVTVSWYLALIGLISMIVGFLYTGGPLPIAHTPLGELMAGFFMGGIITYISFFIQTDFINQVIVYLSLPLILMIGNMLLANSLRDLEEDTRNGRLTLAILLGKRWGTVLYAALWLISFGWTWSLIFTIHLTPFLLLTLIAIPPAAISVIVFWRQTEVIKMIPGMANCSKAIKYYGLLTTLALLISLAF